MAELRRFSRDALVVCSCGGKEYTARDVIDAALFRGELDSIWREFLCNIRAGKRANELELELDEDAIDEMAELFRYEHDLITAEETERWLEDRGLTLEEFSDYFTRRYWRANAEEKISPEDLDLVLASDELRQLFTTELIFDGKLDELTRQLIWRLAAVAANGEAAIDPKEIAMERERFADRMKIKPSELGNWLDSIGRDEQWLQDTSAMEALFRRTCETILIPDARKKQLAMLRMPLTRFQAEVIEVDSLDAAREALLCIREDGMSMEEVAGDARYPYRQITFRHEEVPPDWQQKFWSVGAGGLLEPLPRGESFELYRITSKNEPNLSETIVQERIDERLLERHFSALARDHVQVRLQGVGSME
jgi:hypothetical protein